MSQNIFYGSDAHGQQQGVAPVIVGPPVSVFYGAGHGYLVQLFTIVTDTKLRSSRQDITPDDVTEFPAFTADKVILKGLLGANICRLLIRNQR